MRKILQIGLGLSLGLLAARGFAGDIQWRPAAAPRPTAPANAAATPAVTLGQPVPLATLGQPTTFEDAEPAPIPASIVDRQFRPAGFTTPEPIFRGQSPEAARPLPAGPPPVSPPPGGIAMAPPPPAPMVGYGPQLAGASPGDELYNCGMVTDPACPGPGMCEPMGPCCGEGGCCDGPVFGLLGEWKCFESDHCFDQMISPLSNPFYFEDPRALTELRPMYMYQHMTNPNVVIRNGSINFWGMQARAAITDRWSLVINKFGGIDFAPGSGSWLSGGTSFAELWLGPKYTFIRSPSTGTVAALGLTFQFPTGSNQSFQGRGDFSMTPYFSLAQTFGRSSYGEFNFMGTTGYTFSPDNSRSEHYFASLHLDYDIARLHKIYPLIELNWFHYGRNGGGFPLGFEGRDLINFGNAGIQGHDSLTMAAGVRYKFSESAQLGFGVEFPLSNTKADLFDYRIMIDFIWRY